jgi:hypothetical protein
MKRRSFVQALAAIPAAVPLVAQQTPPTQPVPGGRAGGGRGAAAAPDDTKLEISVPDGTADPMPRFFTPDQFGALRRLSDALMPKTDGSPGAIDTEAPEFLDFLIGKSGADRKFVYRAGLDGLNAQSMKQFNRMFAGTDNTQAEALLAPLRQPWTYTDPPDAVAAFLRVAKADVRTATLNSRAVGAGRRFAGGGLYWYPLD